MVERGGSLKWASYYLGGSKHLLCISGIVCCSLGPVLVITYVFSIIFFSQIQWHFLNSKKGNWVHLGWVKYIWVNSWLLVILT